MTGHAFDKAAIHWAQGEFIWKTTTSTFYMALTTAQPTQSTGEVIGDVTQITGGVGGYTTGGAQITIDANPTITGTDPNSYAKIHSSDVTWATATFTANYGVIYLNSGSYYMLGYIDFGGAKTGQGGNFTVQCPTGGWFEIQTP